jgi:hypothetical protein
MNQEEFELLANRVLAGEASSAEKQILDALLAKDLDRYKEYEAMRVAHRAIRQGLPLTGALKSTAPELPPYRVNELRASVREAFTEAERSERSSTSILAVLWQRISPPAWAWAGGAVLLFLLYLIAMPWGGSRRIEVAMYADYTVRGPTRFASLKNDRHVEVKLFKKDDAFERWKKQRMPRNLGGRIWIDDEKGFIRARWWNAHGKLQELNETMADDTRQQEAQLQELISTIRREAGAK